MDDLTSIWETHRDAGWPHFSSPHEGELMTLDTVISGCVVYYMEHREGLDVQRVEILESCLSDLEALLPDLVDQDSRVYFDRLKVLAHLLLKPRAG